MRRLVCLLLLFLPSVAFCKNHAFLFETDGDWTDAKIVENGLMATIPDVEVAKLNGNKATRQNILKELRRLQKEVKAGELVFLYFSAHGTMQEGEYVTWTEKDGAIYAADWRREIEAIPGNVIAAFDTCHSAGVLQVDWKKTTVLCSSSDDEDTWMSTMSYGIVEALIGLADQDKNGKINNYELVEYLKDRVFRLSSKYQEFRSHVPATKFDVAVPIKADAIYTFKNRPWPVKVMGRSDKYCKVWLASGELIDVKAEELKPVK